MTSKPAPSRARPLPAAIYRQTVLPARKNQALRLWVTGDTTRERAAAAKAAAEEMGGSLHRVDLGDVIGRYIGETDKNLSALLAAAEAKNWILYFDEAEALFGRRTDVREAHDRYANQAISSLLEKLESTGMRVIVAVDPKIEIDPAPLRRWQAWSDPRLSRR